MKKILAGIMAFTMLMGVAYADNSVISEVVDTVSVSAEELTLDNGLTYKINEDGTGITITGCDENATEIEIPAEIDGLPVTSISNWAFESCTSLTSVTIPDSVTNIGRFAFFGCTSLAEINVDLNNKNYSSENGVLFNKDKTEITSYPMGKTVNTYTIPDSVTSIGDKAFYGCESLTEIIIPNSVTSLGDGVFFCCRKLTEITIPDSVTMIDDYTFSGCTSLTEITIPDSVTSIEYGTFSGCTSLTEITIPDSVTTIGWYAFANCTSLTEITIPDSVTYIGEYAFKGCTSLTEITIPDSVTNIGDNAFAETAWYENQNDGCIYIGKTLYKYKGEMPENTSIEIKDGINKICSYALTDCTGLTAITIPDSVTNIGSCAFKNCINLKEITIPDNVRIANDAFDSCENLKINRKELNYDDITKESKQTEATVKKINSGLEDIYTTYGGTTTSYIFTGLDRLTEMSDKNGNIYVMYGMYDKTILVSEKEEIIEYNKEGYTYGCSVIDDNDNLYIMWGKDVSDEEYEQNNDICNIFIGKYSLNGEFIDSFELPLSESEAQYPFDAGNANMEYVDGILGIFYDTEWLGGHQGSEFLALKADNLEKIYFSGWEGSHSLGVSMIPTCNGFIGIQRGDAYSRGINYVINGWSDGEFSCISQGNVFFHSSGAYPENGAYDAEDGSHKNDTHVDMGGIAESKSTYAIVGKSERFYNSKVYNTSVLKTGNYDVFVRIANKNSVLDNFETNPHLAGEDRIDEVTGEVADKNIVWLTECNEKEKAGTVKVVELKSGAYCVLWEKFVDSEFESIHYVIMDECGNILRPESTITGARLSDTSRQPIVQGNTLHWAVADSSTNTFNFYSVELSSNYESNIHISGDIDNDGKITSADALAILQMVVGINDITDELKQTADIDGDGEVTSADALGILQIVVGLR